MLVAALADDDRVNHSMWVFFGHLTIARKMPSHWQGSNLGPQDLHIHTLITQSLPLLIFYESIYLTQPYRKLENDWTVFARGKVDLIWKSASKDFYLFGWEVNLNICRKELVFSKSIPKVLMFLIVWLFFSEMFSWGTSLSVLRKDVSM